MPWEVMRARLILGLGERFGKLPSEILAEDAELWRLLTLETLAAPHDG